MRAVPCPVIGEAMNRLDARGRFQRQDLPHLRGLVEELGTSGDHLDHPAFLFGPWKDLNLRAQATLRRIVEADIRGIMDFFPHGGLWAGTVRGGWELDRFLMEHDAHPWIRRQVVAWSNRLYLGPLKARSLLVRAVGRWQWKRGGRPGPGQLLAALDRTPQWLLGDFVEGVRVDPRARGYYLDPSRNITHAYFVGLDLIPTPQGICCLEANLQAGIVEKRGALNPGPTIVGRVLDAAREHRARRVLWVEGRRLPIRDWMLRDLHQVPSGGDVALEVLEDPTALRRASLPPGVPEPRRWSLPGWAPEDCLVLRRNEFPAGSDYLVNHKEAFIRAIQAALRERKETGAYVLSMSRVPLEVNEPQGPGLPNLVYKYPEGLGGRGVFFLKARDRDHALALARELDSRRGEEPGLFQPFAISMLPDGRRIFGFRMEVVVSPLGSWYLAGFRRAGVGPVPEELPWGLVEGTGVFVADPRTGADLEIMEEATERELSAAALAVAEALRHALERTFVTRPERSASGR